MVDDASKPEPVVAPLANDTRIKVVGLAKAAQYNGQSGVVKAFDRDAGRYEVVLKSGKELKIKRDNMELVDGSIKGGFLSQVMPCFLTFFFPHCPALGFAEPVILLCTAALQSRQSKPPTDTGPEVVRPTGKKGGVLDGMKSLKIDQENVPGECGSGKSAATAKTRLPLPTATRDALSRFAARARQTCCECLCPRSSL